jgi:hypothetical protein
VQRRQIFLFSLHLFFFISNQHNMPTDICMCTGGDCPQKQHCLRFTGAIYGRQDFFGTPPYLQNPNKCEHFLDDRPSPDAVRVQAYFFWQQAGCPSGRDMSYWLRAEAYLLELIRR